MQERLKICLYSLIGKYNLERLSSIHQYTVVFLQQSISREKIPFVMCIEQIQNQMALQIKLEFIFHFIHKHVCKHTWSRCRGYAVWTSVWSESSHQTVRCYKYCSKLHQFRSISLSARAICGFILDFKSWLKRFDSLWPVEQKGHRVFHYG